MSKLYKAKVNDSDIFNIDSSELENVNLIKKSKNNFHVLYNNKSYHIELLDGNFINKNYNVNINNNQFKIQIHDELDVLIDQLGFSTGSQKKENTIKAPMPGLILNINVKKDQEVKKGDVLLVLEAMKMENAITAQSDGIIKNIFVKKGKAVEKGTLLIEFN